MGFRWAELPMGTLPLTLRRSVPTARRRVAVQTQCLPAYRRLHCCGLSDEPLPNHVHRIPASTLPKLGLHAGAVSSSSP